MKHAPHFTGIAPQACAHFPTAECSDLTCRLDQLFVSMHDQGTHLGSRMEVAAQHSTQAPRQATKGRQHLGRDVVLSLLLAVFSGEEGHHLVLRQSEAVLHALLPLPALPVGLALHEALRWRGCIAVPPARTATDGTLML